MDVLADPTDPDEDEGIAGADLRRARLAMAGVAGGVEVAAGVVFVTAAANTGLLAGAPADATPMLLLAVPVDCELDSTTDDGIAAGARQGDAGGGGGGGGSATIAAAAAVASKGWWW